MTYKLNPFGYVVRVRDGANLPTRWDGGPTGLGAGNGDVDEFLEWVSQGNEPAPYVPTKDEQNAPILRELEANDKKAIRALLDGDSVRVSEWKAKQAALRARLVK